MTGEPTAGSTAVATPRRHVDDAGEPVEAVVAGALAGLFRRDSLYMVTWALQLLAAAALTPVITRLLATDQFGAVAAATAVMQVLFVLTDLGLATALQRRYAGPGGPTEARKLLALAAMLAGLLTVVADATGPLWSGPLGFESYGGALRLAVWWAGTSAVTNVALSLLRSRDRLLAFSAVGLLQSVGASAASLLLVALLAPTATMFVLGQLLLQIVALVVALRLAPPALVRMRDTRLAREALAYGLPLVPALLCTFVLAAADRLIVQMQLGQTAVARYQVAYNVGDMPMLLLGVLATAWMPRIFALDGAHERAAVIGASRDALYRLLAPVIVGLAVGAPLVLRVWAPPEYGLDGLLLVTTLVIITAVPFTAVLAATRALLADGGTATIAGTTGIAAVANIVLNLVLVPQVGLAGAAGATLLAYAVQHVVLVRRLQGRIAIPATSRARLLGVAGASAVALVSTEAPLSPGFLVWRGVVAAACLVWFARTVMDVSRSRPPGSAAPPVPAPVPSDRPAIRAQPNGSVTELAAVVLAHADPTQLGRLVGALDDVPIVLHCDARTPPDVARQMALRLPRRVSLSDRIPARRASWSLVEAELVALRQLLRTSRPRHVAVLSGADYPLLPMQEIYDQLEAWDGQSFFRNAPLPFDEWNTPTHHDGGLWRLRYRFVTWRGQVVFVRGIPLRWPRPRHIPREVELRAASQWKIYSRDHVEMLLHAVDTRPDLVRFWRSTLVPDESFAASMLGSRALFGSYAMPTCLAHPWYMIWPGPGSPHPRWLGSDDFDRLSEARWARPVRPDAALGAPGHDAIPHRKLFARKFSTAVDTDVLDRIDCELRR